MSDRVDCRICSVSILAATGEQTGRLCMRCSKGPGKFKVFKAKWLLLFLLGLCVMMSVAVLLQPVPHELGIRHGVGGPKDVSVVDLFQEVGVGVEDYESHSNSVSDQMVASIRYEGFSFRMTIKDLRDKMPLGLIEKLFSASLKDSSFGDQAAEICYRRTGDFVTFLMTNGSAEVKKVGENLLSKTHAEVLSVAGSEVNYRPFLLELIDKVRSRAW